MLELAAYESRKRVRGALALSGGLAAFSLLYIAFFPSVSASGADLDAYVESLPPAIRAAFDIRTLTTIEGFLATELYAFAWTLLLGVYFAYSAASVVAADVESDRMDLLLSLPVTRVRLLGEKVSALLVPMVAVNVVVPLVTYAGVLAIGESISPTSLAVVHLLSLPYLLTCVGIGLLVSVSVDRASVAQRVAIAAVFGLFLLESVVNATDYAAVGAVAPMRYFDPAGALVDGSYDLLGGLILLVGGCVLLGAAAWRFERMDVQ